MNFPDYKCPTCEYGRTSEILKPCAGCMNLLSDDAQVRPALLGHWFQWLGLGLLLGAVVWAVW